MISIAIPVIKTYNGYEYDKILVPIRNARGGGDDLPVRVKKLALMFPNGVDDVNRMQFLLHDKLRDGVDLRARELIKILPGAALTTADDLGSYPLHLACCYCSVNVVQHMIKVDSDLMNILDKRNETPLHYACRGANHSVVRYLLEKKMVAVSQRNIYNELPIHLLCASKAADQESPECLETIWLLLLAYPERRSLWY